METEPVTSRDICLMMTGGDDDPKAIRAAMARLGTWQRTGLLKSAGCDALEVGVGRGGKMTYPRRVMPWAAILDRATDDGAVVTELVSIVQVLRMEPDSIDRALAGDSVIVWWTRVRGLPSEHPPLGQALIGDKPAWPSGRFLDLGKVLSRVRV